MNFRSLFLLLLGITLTSALTVCAAGQRQIIYTDGEGIFTACIGLTTADFRTFLRNTQPIILWDSANPQLTAPTYRDCGNTLRPGTNCTLPVITATPTCQISNPGFVSLLWSVNASTLQYNLTVPSGPDNYVTPSIYYQTGQNNIPAGYVGPLFWQDIPLVGTPPVLPGPVEFVIPGIVSVILPSLAGIPQCASLCTGNTFQTCLNNTLNICGWTYTLPDLVNGACLPITQNLLTNVSTVVYTQDPPTVPISNDVCSCHTDCLSCTADSSCSFCDTTNTCYSTILAENICPDYYPSVLHEYPEECPCYCSIDNLCDGYTLFDSLRSLYLSTNGQYWTLQSGWNGIPSTDVCNWYGVDCEARSISLPNNNLNGSINPIFFCALQDFKVVDLSNNNLVGCIPKTIAKTHLQILDLRNNSLSCAVPPFGQLTQSIQYLYLQDNNLVGPFPADIPRSIYLKEFHLQNNALSGEVPVGLAYLTELLEASFNCQTGNQLYPPYPNFIKDLRALLGLLPSQLPEIDVCE